MPNRFSNPRRKLIRDALLERDGHLCIHCKAPFGKNHRLQPTIDHVDTKKENHAPENLVLMHRKCNTKEGNMSRHGYTRRVTPENVAEHRAKALEKWLLISQSMAEKPAKKSGVTRVKESEREKEKTGTNGDMRKGWGSSEETAALLMVPHFRKWLILMITRHGSISTSDAINGGTERLVQDLGRGSQQTVRRYFEAATSIEGFLVERRDKGRVVWVFREDKDIPTMMSELEAKTKTIEGKEIA